MNTERFMEMVRLRSCGFSYREIGEMVGVSAQYVHQCIGRRFKGNLAEIKRIKLREWFRKTQMSVPSFCTHIFGTVNGNLKNKMHSFLKGSHVEKFTLNNIITMCELTGLTLSELAELDREVE